MPPLGPVLGGILPTGMDVDGNGTVDLDEWLLGAPSFWGGLVVWGPPYLDVHGT